MMITTARGRLKRYPLAPEYVRRDLRNAIDVTTRASTEATGPTRSMR